MVRAFFCRTGALEPRHRTAANVILSADERSRCARLAMARDRDEYAVAHALLRTSIGHAIGRAPERLVFKHDDHNRSSLIGGALTSAVSFSVSRTRGLVAAAISMDGVAVGIDVETVDRQVDFEGIARQYFAPSENDVLAAAVDQEERAARFFQFWTLREALLKATGADPEVLRTSAVFEVGQEAALSARPPLRRGEWRCVASKIEPLHQLAVVAAADHAPPAISVTEVRADDLCPAMRAIPPRIVHPLVSAAAVLRPWRRMGP